MTPVNLRLREFRDSDLDILASMVGDAEQMRFYPRPKTRAEAETPPPVASDSRA